MFQIRKRRAASRSTVSNLTSKPWVELTWLMGQLTPDFKTIADWNGSLASEAAKT